jgi:hypothetical protein
MVYLWNPASGMPDFIKTLYLNVLDRHPENQAVVDHWTNKAYSVGLAPTIAGFFESNEYRAKNLSPEDTVGKLYAAILARAPEPDGKAYYVRRLNRQRMSMEDVVRDFLGSAEYRWRVRNGFAPHPGSYGTDPHSGWRFGWDGGSSL